jgi:flagellar basal-body rod protein FlgB
MKTIENHLSVYSNALNLRGKRNKILASNIANAATPHFKARDIDFETEIKKREKIGDISVNHEKHFALLSKVRPNDMLFREPLNPSLDGNTVELAVEQMEFSENVVRYQTTLQFLSNKINGLMSAIRGE